MLHPTMLDDVAPTCWLRLIRRISIVSNEIQTINKLLTIFILIPFDTTEIRRIKRDLV